MQMRGKTDQVNDVVAWHYSGAGGEPAPHLKKQT